MSEPTKPQRLREVVQQPAPTRRCENGCDAPAIEHLRICQACKERIDRMLRG